MTQQLTGEKMEENKKDVTLMTAEREKVIVRTSIIGILANVLLAGFKAAIGLATRSIAVTLDAVNNLSDALSSVITIIGARQEAPAGLRKDRVSQFNDSCSHRAVCRYNRFGGIHQENNRTGACGVHHGLTSDHRSCCCSKVAAWKIRQRSGGKGKFRRTYCVRF